MKVLRGIAVTCLYLAIAFLAMVLTSLSFHFGWMYAVVLLLAIWLVYFLGEFLRWKFLANPGLAAFVGYATGLLKETDRFTTPAQAELVSSLPSSWVGGAGLAFYFIFVALLPWLASVLATKLRSPKSTGQTQSKYPSSVEAERSQ